MLSEVTTIFVACFIDFIELFGDLLSYNKKGCFSRSYPRPTGSAFIGQGRAGVGNSAW